VALRFATARWHASGYPKAAQRDEGFIVEDLSVPCDEFRASLVLYADDFRVRSTLLDDAGFQVVQRVVEDTVVIRGDQGVTLSMDFPGVALPPTPDGGVAPGVPGAPDAGTGSAP
jgi:hypothetical protein